MRNWNHNISIYSYSQEGKFWAYLWGIETNIIHITISLMIHFEPTYEELKLKSLGNRRIKVSEFWAYLWGIETIFSSFGSKWGNLFEPTYEELKLLEIPSLDNLLPCFEPTYEELKQANCTYYKMVVTVLSLPMRNWNGWVLLK